jgi:hypothetical protein
MSASSNSTKRFPSFLALLGVVVIATNTANIFSNLLNLSPHNTLSILGLGEYTTLISYAMVISYLVAAFFLAISLIVAAVRGARGGTFMSRRRSIIMGLCIAATAVLIEATSNVQGFVTMVTLPVQLGLAWFFLSGPDPARDLGGVSKSA